MKVRLNLGTCTLTFVLLALSHAVARGQGSLFEGRLLDQTGGVITGARVTATSHEQPSPMSTQTDERGAFVLALPPGLWTVTLEADGFDPLVERLEMNAASHAREFTLRVAGVHDTVSIVAARGYTALASRTATRTPTPLRDIPQSITVVTNELMKDQLMTSVADVVHYVPGITMHQGENNRDQIIVRGNSSSADFFVNGVRDDAQYYRDLYNLDRIEALKGPNAMIFGRGGAGGVVNRVTKEARFQPLRELAFQAGAFDNKRLAADLAQPLNARVALRLNGMFEDSGSFREAVTVSRFGVSPTATVVLGPVTRLKVDYEYLHDRRVADRGMPSFQGRPLDLDIATFYGDPAKSHVRSDVNVFSAALEHSFGRLAFRNSTHLGYYDRFYQNYVPGAVSVDKAQVALSSYSNATVRHNVFNQTDLTSVISTGRIRHTVLGGAELGRQLTDNVRNTGFFNNTNTTLNVPFDKPTTDVPVTFRQSATDADNHLRVRLAALYAQDQVELTRGLQLVGGVRVDRFDLTYHNNRNDDTLQRVDNLVAPRIGVVVKPAQSLSVYGSHSLSYLPSSGDQFSSLTTVTQQLKPEKFLNYEGGFKWEVKPSLSLTSAVYRLNRTNTRATDPNDPTRIVQTGSQRTNGFEIGLAGHLLPVMETVGGYSYQHAYVTSATAAARAGATVGQVPRHTLTLWNNYRVQPRLKIGFGIISRSDMFAAIDDTVTLPGYVRADAGLYFSLKPDVRFQANVENLFDAGYFANADSNTNISPGSPRTLRAGLTIGF